MKTLTHPQGLLWQALNDGGGYTGLEPAGGRQVALLRYPDGWRLIAVASHADGDRAQTETEARAWAARALEIQAKIAHRHTTPSAGQQFPIPVWHAGPTPDPAITTLYANA